MKCKKLKRLTIANPQNAKSNTEQLMNFAYAKDNKVFIPQPYKDDIDLCEYISKLTKVKGCNLPPEEIMEGACLECDRDCEIGILYYCAVQAAELRERLKMFEDKLENGTLIELPCKVGDEIWYIPGYVARPNLLVGTITDIQISSNDYGVRIWQTPLNGYFMGRNFNVNWFTDQEKAEQKLKELQND